MVAARVDAARREERAKVAAQLDAAWREGYAAGCAENGSRTGGTKYERAVYLLRETCSGRWVPQQQVAAISKSADIGWRTVEGAMREAGVQTRRVGGRYGRSEWTVSNSASSAKGSTTTGDTVRMTSSADVDQHGQTARSSA